MVADLGVALALTIVGCLGMVLAMVVIARLLWGSN